MTLDPVTITEMVRRIEAGRDVFDRAFDAAGPLTANGWTPKDHMAHLAVWSRSALNLLNGEARFLHLGLTMEESARMHEDAINERAYRSYRDTSVQQVAGDYDAAFAELIAKLRSLDDEDLGLPYSHYQPHDPPWNGSPVWPWIIDNSADHCEEHAEMLRAV